tara:strand:+ start:107 stop:1114 length:1008 start_codon:yes stop_codon:yes gene_type:complete
LNNSNVTIIAEAGVNHNGSIDTAKKLIDVAAEAGANMVKFQTFKAENIVTKIAEKAEYQKIYTEKSESQFEMLKKLELSKQTHFILIDYCKEKNIQFLSTPFDHESIDFLAELNIPLFKIPSGEITNLPYLRHVGRMGKPVILSTGMSTLGEIKEAINVLHKSGIKKKEMTILHCNSEYPTPIKDVNLKAMVTIKNELDINVGYSDHTLGVEISIAAAAMGAKVIEKHFTLDNSMQGPDHAASIEPHELKNMVMSIRNVEQSLGNGIKSPSNSEKKNITVARRSIVAKCQIIRGEKFTEKNLTVKRPGKGISPMQWDGLLGKIADKKYQKDELIR